MAENVEKTITIKIDGGEKTLANLDKVEQAAGKIRKQFADTGKVIPDVEVKKLSKEIANADANAKKLGRSFKEVTRNIAGAEGGIKGFVAGFAGGLAVGAVETLTNEIYQLITAETEAERQASSLKKATDDLAVSYANEIVEVESLFQPLFDVNTESDVRSNLIDQIQDKYGDYIGNINLETASQEDLALAYIAVKNAIVEKIKVEAKQQALASTFATISQAQLKLNEVLARNERDIVAGLTKSNDRYAIRTTLIAEQVDVITKAKEEFKSLSDAIDDAGNSLLTIDFSGLTVPGVGSDDGAGSKGASKKVKDLTIDIKDLESAIKHLQEVSKTGNAEELIQAKELVELYKQQAVEKANAAKAIDEDILTGRPTQEIKDDIILEKEQLRLIEESLKISDLELKNLLATNKTINDAGEKLVQIFSTTGEELDINKFKGQLQDLLKETDSIQAFRAKASVFGFVFPKSDEDDDALIRLSRSLALSVQELNALEKQAAAAGIDVAEIQKKANDAILEADTAFINRKKESDKAKLEAIAKSPELTAAALELAGEVSLERIKANLKSQADAVLEASFQAEQAFIEAATKIGNEISGFSQILGSADEGFRVNPEVLNVGLPEDYKRLEKLALEANERLTLGKKAYNLSIQNLDIDAADQLIKNAAIASRREIRQDKATLDAKTLQFKLEKDRLFKLDKESSENRHKLGLDANAEEVAEVNGHIDELLALKNDEIKLELRVSVDRYITLLEQSKGNAAEQLVVWQEFNNKRNEIIANGQKDLDDIVADFVPLLDKVGNDEQIAKVKAIVAELISFANQAAQLVDNIFAIVIQNQQNVVDGIVERISIVDTALTDSQSRLNELESDLEGKRSGRREAILRGIALEKEREIDLANEKIALGIRLEAEETKLRKKRKAAALTQAIINGAISITQLNASIVDTTPVQAFRIAANIALGAVIGTQIALIASQKFAKGGHTGSANGNRDETGHTPVGIVHNDEYVVPKWQVQSSQYRPLVDQLEQGRTRGFASGGFTSPDFGALSSSVSGNVNTNIMTIVQRSVDAALALSNRPTYVNVTDISNVSNTVSKRVQATTIGG